MRCISGLTCTLHHSWWTEWWGIFAWHYTCNPISPLVCCLTLKPHLLLYALYIIPMYVYTHSLTQSPVSLCFSHPIPPLIIRAAALSRILSCPGDNCITILSAWLPFLGAFVDRPVWSVSWWSRIYYISRPTCACVYILYTAHSILYI